MVRLGGWLSTTSVATSLALGAALAVSAGCHGARAWSALKWPMDLESAEQAQRDTGRPLLLTFFDSRASANETLTKALASASVKSLVRDYIRCTLHRTHEADRRYVGQFGVERAPALILIHPDRTYHAFDKPATEDAVVDFLNTAVPPGSAPIANPQVPRSVRYAWGSDLGAARAQAARESKSLLVVLHRWWTNDWGRVSAMLDRQEVYRRAAEMVHCRVTGVAGLPTDEMAAHGVTRLPAIVVVRPDGSSTKLELPTGYEAIARFLDSARTVSVVGQNQP